jgi:hypothetical protein
MIKQKSHLATVLAATLALIAVGLIVLVIWTFLR